MSTYIITSPNFLLHLFSMGFTAKSLLFELNVEQLLVWLEYSTAAEEFLAATVTPDRWLQRLRCSASYIT